MVYEHLSENCSLNLLVKTGIGISVVVDVVKFRGLFFIQVQYRSVTELRSCRK